MRIWPQIILDEKVDHRTGGGHWEAVEMVWDAGTFGLEHIHRNFAGSHWNWCWEAKIWPGSLEHLAWNISTGVGAVKQGFGLYHWIQKLETLDYLAWRTYPLDLVLGSKDLVYII